MSSLVLLKWHTHLLGILKTFVVQLNLGAMRICTLVKGWVVCVCVCVCMQKWVCRLDLESGVYALLPYTSGCHLRVPEDENVSSDVIPLIARDGSDSVTLTDEAKRAFTAIFHQIDLDSNGSVSRSEFDFFNEITSGEICDDEAWKIVQSEFIHATFT